MKNRVPIADDLAAEILFRQDHTCCVCNEKGKHVQIHHIDDDPSNNIKANLAVLCMEDHANTQVTGGFGRKLSATEITKYRDDWVKRVTERRKAADNLAVQKTSGKKETTSISETEWRQPSDIALYSLVPRIPDIMKTAYDLAQPEWNKGATNTVTQATYQIIDVVEQLWNQVAAWYPPNHFGKPSAQYFSEFIASRFEFRRALMESDGPGTAGTLIRPMVAYGVLLDAQQALVLTVRLLLLFHAQQEGFDIEVWNKHFEEATSGYTQ